MKANNVAVAALNDIKVPKDEATTSTELTSEPPAKKLKESETLETLTDKSPIILSEKNVIPPSTY